VLWSAENKSEESEGRRKTKVERQGFVFEGGILNGGMGLDVRFFALRFFTVPMWLVYPFTCVPLQRLSHIHCS